MKKLLTIICILLLTAGTSVADSKKKKSKKKSKTDASFFTALKTNIDFDDTLIEGKMKAPAGFYLQGRQAQTLTQMIKLRSNFRSELRNSRSAVKSLVK